MLGCWVRSGRKCPSVVADDTGIQTIRGYLAQGNVTLARHWFQQWVASNLTLQRDPPAKAVPVELRRFGDDLDAHLRCTELSRYLQAKALAQQKSLLQ